MAFSRDEAAVGRAARNRSNQDLKTEAFREKESSLLTFHVSPVAQLTPVVVAPRKELGVAAMNLIKVSAWSALVFVVLLRLIDRNSVVLAESGSRTSLVLLLLVITRHIRAVVSPVRALAQRRVLRIVL